MSKAITFIIKCTHCGKTFNITMTEQQCFDYHKVGHVQEGFPVIISGICGKCYDAMTGE